MTTYKLYDGEVELEFHEKLGRKKHVYTIDDEEVANVTKVLGIIDKPALVYWAANSCGDYIKKNVQPGVSYTMDEIELENFIKEMKGYRFKTSGEAMEIGTIVHAFAEDWANGKKPPPPINKQAAQGALAFVDWWLAHNVQPVAMERKLYSREHGYCGTADLVAVVDGKMSMIDYKTSKAIYDEYFYQVGGAYRKAYEEETGDKIEQALVVRFDKLTGEFETQASPDMDGDWEIFLNALNLFKNINERKAA